MHRTTCLLIATTSWLLMWPVNAATPAQFEVVFSEIMIDPISASSEWVEVYNRTDQVMSLNGCLLMDQNDTSSSTCDVNGQSYPGKCYTLEGVSDLPPTDFQVLAVDQDALQSTCGLQVAGDYDTVTFNNSGSEILHLWCPSQGGYVDVASIEYNLGSLGLSDGQSYMLHQGHLSQEGGDPSTWAWCAVPMVDENVFCTDETGTQKTWGTPNAASNCPMYPEAGQVIFSEINLWPSSASDSSEWIEFLVVGDTSGGLAELTGCSLRRFNCSSAGLDDADCLALASPAWSKNVSLTPLVADVSLVAGTRLLMAPVSDTICLGYDQDDTERCIASAQMGYGSGLDLPGTDVRLLELACPSITEGEAIVDRVLYSGTDLKADCVQSDNLCTWELRPDALNASDNTDRSNWGAAVPSGTDGDTGAEYAVFEDGVPESVLGTPGQANSVGARVYSSPVRVGDMAFTELAPWPSTNTTSPDWLELSVFKAPELDVFDMGTCVLRSVVCSEGSNAADCLQATVAEDGWGAQSSLEPQNGSLTPVAGERLVFGGSTTKTCLESDALGVCTQEVDATFSSSVGLQATDTRLIELACPNELGEMVLIDRVVYDKGWVDPLCAQEGDRCSWELRTAPDGTALEQFNDDPGNWGPGTSNYFEPDANDEVRGTPGRENSVQSMPDSAGPPGVGDVVFSELLIKPSKGPEWFELTWVGTPSSGGAYDLGGCMLIQEGAEELGLCSPLYLEGCKSHTIPDPIRLTAVQGDPRLFVRSAGCLAYGLNQDDGSTECRLESDYSYAGLDFGTGEVQALALWCPAEGAEATVEGWVEVDRLQYDWPLDGAQCVITAEETTDDGAEDTPGTEGATWEVGGIAACALEIHQDYLTAEFNDDRYYRCIPGEDSGYYDVGGFWTTGTPRAGNVCGGLPRVPGPGDLVISELMVAPLGSNDTNGSFVNEWFELYNPGSETYDFSTCALWLTSVLEDDSMDLEGIDEEHQAGNAASIAGGIYQVWAIDGCLFGYDGACGEEGSDTSPELGIRGDVAYSGISFANSARRIFQLRCAGPGQVLSQDETIVDSILVDGSWIEGGHSWQIQAEFLSADDNDDPLNWCQATFAQDFLVLADGTTNYGTPGAANDCSPPPPYDGTMPGCRCSLDPRSRPDLGSLGLFALVAIQLVGRRRRR